ncbi:thiol-disulfide oxidoreductase DCC family protein [uncultured Gimesia sp.]|uniref:thiol-disulfide oxidoreductase DCC family protein n=1 Tax=uncultured Gimesia sp. TaxID=1678688 RepID=UPI0026113FBF|nr:DUF393 domain-containing protein [uncultured Gimesia sp.]
MNHQFEIEAFYDAECPLCLREVNMIRRLDRKHKILFTNIADPKFDAEAYGKTWDQFMNEMHARLPDGSWVTGVEVFRRLYTAAGLGWIVLPTRLPVVSQLLDLTYCFCAKNRLRFTGRCNHQNGSCRVPHDINEVS